MARNNTRYKLLDGCEVSAFTVFPADWNDTGADASLTWYATYRFYDSAHGGARGKLVQIKGGVNRFTTLSDKRGMMKLALEKEREEIFAKGWNPVRGVYMAERVEAQEYIISPATPLVHALAAANARFVKRGEEPDGPCKGTLAALRQVLAAFTTAAEKKGLARKPIGEVTKANLIVILEAIGDAKGKGWTANNYNRHRANISTLFAELVDIDTIDDNPVSRIKKKVYVAKARDLPDDTQRATADEKLREHHPRLHRFMNIFYHSGARLAEMVQVRREDVDLTGQRVRYTVRKGRQGRAREVWRPIKDTALPLWEEVVSEAGPGQYLFAYQLKPGDKPIDRAQMSRKWRRAAEKFGLDFTLYTLKHANTTEMAASLGVGRVAGGLNKHSEEVARKHYDVEAQQREDDDIKRAGNTFVKKRP